MTAAGIIGFALLAVNPIGGLLVAIPFAVFKLDWPAWLPVVVGLPLAYVQVLVVDLGWTQLERWGWWRKLIERSRSKWAQRLVESRGGFWITFIATPIIGPWLVMGLMRWAGVPHRKVAAPMILSLALNAAMIALACVLVPTLFASA